jgi:hypothetical protein
MFKPIRKALGIETNLHPDPEKRNLAAFDLPAQGVVRNPQEFGNFTNGKGTHAFLKILKAAAHIVMTIVGRTIVGKYTIMMPHGQERGTSTEDYQP